MLPAAFVESLHVALGADDAHNLLESLNTSAPVSVRINPKKFDFGNIQGFEPVPWCQNGIYLPNRPVFSTDPLLHLGHYYVQEASSMMIGEVVRQLLFNINSTSLVLDLCAAPGGKSTHIASVLGSSDLLVANEIISSRTPVLEENLAKWGCANHIVTRADAEFWGHSGILFDVVVADLPCSGEGMFRKDPEAIKHWNPTNVELCAQRQRRIVSEVWKAIKPGGYLIYSTCTFNRTENEDNINRLKTLPGFTIVDSQTSSLSFFKETETNMYRALPCFTKGEGFFVAVIQKQAENPKSKTTSTAKQFKPLENNGLWPKSVTALQRGDDVYATQNEGGLFMNTIQQLPGYYSPGVCIGKIIRNVFKPHAKLALIAGIEQTKWPITQLTDFEVMAYLRRDTLNNPEQFAETRLATWNNRPVGFLSPNKSRWNNLWPIEWRLRMDVKEPSCWLGC